MPNRSPARPWLHLLDDEVAPVVLESRNPEYVVWSSLWPRRRVPRGPVNSPPRGVTPPALRVDRYSTGSARRGYLLGGAGAAR
ncbi:hypothetical protein [Mycobacteroides abscessus]|uniref:hypothetical protein n=1 Tax=Mycobacteroides abscessus TaxID=36809 RepID=UPI00147656EC